MDSLPRPVRYQADRAQQLVLRGRARDAEDEHDSARRERFAGVTRDGLDREKARWTRVGRAIADVARLVCETCAASAFGETRPKVNDVTERLSEAIDDQFDGEAWRVVDASARLAATEQ